MPFVGRERELAELGGLPAGRVVLVAGEPGVGKSALVAEAANRYGMPWCAGRAVDDEGSPPYLPFHQAVRALRQRGLVPDGPADLVPAEPDARDRYRAFDDVTALLTAAAEPAGLAVVLDDLHWADPASLHLLLHLTRAIAGSRLTVLATYRDTEPGPALREALAALSTEQAVHRIALGGLAEPEVGALLGSVLGWPVPDSVAAAVRARTQGNPFFVTELARVLGRDGGGGLPAGVRDAVRARLLRLPPAARTVVEAAAVLRTMDLAALARVTGLAAPQTLDALDAATAAGLLTGEGFGHDLVRETARAGVPAARRHALHDGYARLLTNRSDAPDRLAEIAHHMLEALPLGSAAATAEWAERAADRATAQLAWEQGADLYERAAAAAADAGEGPDTRVRLLLGAARARVRAYAMEDARRLVGAVAEAARAAGDAEALAEAVLVLDAVTDFAWTEGRALVAEALAALPNGDSPLRARVLAQYAAADAWQAFDEGEARSTEALEMAGRTGDEQALRAALRARQLARSGPDGVHERLVLAARLLASGRTDDDVDVQLWARLWRLDALAQLGRLAEAEVEVAPIRELATRLRSPLADWHAERCRCAIALSCGRFDEAQEAGERILALARRAGHAGTVVPSLGFLAVLHAQTGRGEWPYRFEDRDAPPRHVHAVRTQLLLAAGRRDEALAIYRSLPPPLEVPGFMLLPVLGSTAELAWEFADVTAAATVHRMLAPYPDLFVCGGAGIVAVLGPVRTSLGLAAATIGRHDEGVTHLRAGIEAAEAAGMPPAAAEARGHLAAVLARRRRTGDEAEAVALATQAGAQAERLGMAPLQARCRRLQGGGDVLTRREREIAGWVADGLTNREIGAVAHISERTAENHVQHVLAKLGLANRAQIAAWVTARRTAAG